jgi:hypothetical protein
VLVMIHNVDSEAFVKTCKPLRHPYTLDNLEYSWAANNKNDESQQIGANGAFFIRGFQWLGHIPPMSYILTVFLVTKSHCLLGWHCICIDIR